MSFTLAGQREHARKQERLLGQAEPGLRPGGEDDGGDGHALSLVTTLLLGNGTLRIGASTASDTYLAEPRRSASLRRISEIHDDLRRLLGRRVAELSDPVHDVEALGDLADHGMYCGRQAGVGPVTTNEPPRRRVPRPASCHRDDALRVRRRLAGVSTVA